MKKIWIILMLTMQYGKMTAQNLVNNWSFEDTVACPTATAQIDRAIGWNSYRESPDYFNACAPTSLGGVSVPQNAWGYQYAKTGNAYAGFVGFGSSSTNSREFLGCTLNQSTQIGQKYFVSFYVSRAHNNYGMQWACNNIGMRFSTTLYSDTNPAPINNIAYVNDTTIIVDTTNWVKISGAFLADSIYSYVMFGNFFDDSLTSSMQIGPHLGYAYYYIDDIRISTDSNFVNLISKASYSPQLSTIFPNLVRDWIVIRQSGIYDVEIINMTGKVVLASKDILLPQKIDVSNLSQGLYCVRVISKNKLIINKFIKR